MDIDPTNRTYKGKRVAMTPEQRALALKYPNEWINPTDEQMSNLLNTGSTNSAYIKEAVSSFDEWFKDAIPSVANDYGFRTWLRAKKIQPSYDAYNQYKKENPNNGNRYDGSRVVVKPEQRDYKPVKAKRYSGFGEELQAIKEGKIRVGK